MRQIAMISGGGRGLGAAIANQLLDDGWRVSLGVRKPDLVREQFLERHEQDLHIAHFDADEPSTAATWTDDATRHYGQLDALINNAGILKMVDFNTGTEDDLDLLWQTNVKAPFRLIKHALPHLRKTGQGRVINIASTDAKRYRDASVSLGYVMTKHALLAMSHAVRFAGWDDGVRATAICPGAIDTDMIDGIRGVTPKNDRISPGTIARIVSFLLTLPNQASVPEIVTNTRLESTL